MIKKLSFLASKSNVYNGLIQIATILINLMLMPLLLHILDKARFGVWQTILAFIGYASLLNFGMGNGLRNTVSKYFVESNWDAIGNLTGQTIIKLLKIIGCFSLVIFPLYFYFFNPNILFKDVRAMEHEVSYSIGIYLSFFLFNIIASLVSSVSFGLNRSYLPGLFNVIYLVIVYGILMSYRKTNADLITVSFLFGCAQVCINLLFFAYLLRKYKIKLSFNKEYDLKETSKLSGYFFAVQLLSIIFLTADTLIVSNLLGASYTAEYSIISKIYFTLISVFSILLISFWNGVTIAYTKKDYVWIKNGVKQLLGMSGVVLIIGLLIMLFNKTIIDLWFGKDNKLLLQTTSFMLFSIFAFLHCFNAVFINFQNGIGDMKIQIISTSIMIVILLIGSYAIDMQRYGYNALIIIKIVAVFMGILINLNSLKKLR